MCDICNGSFFELLAWLFLSMPVWSPIFILILACYVIFIERWRIKNKNKNIFIFASLIIAIILLLLITFFSIAVLFFIASQ